jgi:hypothetical protein
MQTLSLWLSEVANGAKRNGSAESMMIDVVLFSKG